jgi:hypothetical protein
MHRARLTKKPQALQAEDRPPQRTRGLTGQQLHRGLVNACVTSGKNLSAGYT